MSEPTGVGATPPTGGDYSPTIKPEPGTKPPGSQPGSSSSKPTSPFAPAEVSGAEDGAKFGKFVRTQRLGAGGMGEVWKAWDTQLSRWVALKFLKGGDEDEILRFKREAQTAGQLSHPNIAAVYEVGEDRNRHYIAMQFVDGQTLKTYPRNDKMALARLMRDAARAVAYAHQQGIVHRDLKPENLMVTQRGREPHLYVMDFGLARAIEGGSELSVSGSVVGTPSYMPPEQARGERVDTRADVYSLGATMYEVLTDRVPFKGANVYETLRKVQEEDPAPPRKLDPKVDSDFETIVLTCLEKEPSRRYATSKELADDLDRFLEGEPISARRASIVYRIRRRLAKKKAVVLTGLGATAVVGLVLAVLVPKLWQKQEEFRKAQRELVEQMRVTSMACLETALELRRVNRVDGMPKYAVKVEEACREVAEKITSIGEPNYRLGRMYRAQLREDDAWREQEEALKREGGYAPALYEAVVLRLRRYRRMAEERGAQDAEGAVLKREMSALIARLEPAMVKGEQEAEAIAEAEAAKLPPEAEEKARAETREKEREKARQWLLPSPQEAACLRGIKAWLGGAADDEFLKDAKKKTPHPEEAYDLLVAVAFEKGDRAKAVEWWTTALENDAGCAAHYWNRAALQLGEARRREAGGGDASKFYESVEADGERAIDVGKKYLQGIEQQQKEYEKEKGRAEPARQKEIERTLAELKRWPAMVEGWNVRSREYRGLGKLGRWKSDARKTREGLSDLEEVVKGDPSRGPALKAVMDEARKRLEE
jgi:hypothetical protein